MGIDIWVILLIYSFVQGYILSVYAIFKLRDYFLFGLLFTVSTLILGYLYYQLNWYQLYPQFIFFEAPFWYLIGPLLFLFVKNLFNKSTSWWEYLIHLMPFVAFLVFLGPFYFLDANEKLDIHVELFSINTYDGDPNHYMFSIHRLIYIIITLIALKRFNKEQKIVTAESTLIYDEFAESMLKFFMWYSIAALIFYFFVDQFYSQVSAYFSILYLFLSLLIHLTFYYAFLREKNEGEVKAENDRKYSSSSLSNTELNAIIDKLLTHVSQPAVYSNSSLRLKNVSDELEIPSHYISQAINVILEKNFFDLVNEFRVRAVKENINNPRFRHYTLVAIALEYGFKSSSSFYRIFKKYTGQTPKEYLSEIQSKE